MESLKASSDDDDIVLLEGAAKSSCGPILTCIKYSPHGKYIACGCASGVVLIIDGITNEILYKGYLHIRAVTSIVFSKCGKKLYSISAYTGENYDGIIECSLDSEFSTRSIPVDTHISTTTIRLIIQFVSNDDTLILVAGEGASCMLPSLVSVSTGKILRLPGSEEITSPTFSTAAVHDRVVYYHHHNRAANNIIISRYDHISKKTLKPLSIKKKSQDAAGTIRKMCHIDVTDTHVVLLTSANEIYVYSVNTRTAAIELKKPTRSTTWKSVVKLSPDGCFIFAAKSDKSCYQLHIYNTSSGDKVKYLEGRAPATALLDFTLHPNYRYKVVTTTTRAGKIEVFKSSGTTMKSTEEDFEIPANYKNERVPLKGMLSFGKKPAMTVPNVESKKYVTLYKQMLLAQKTVANSDQTNGSNNTIVGTNSSSSSSSNDDLMSSSSASNYSASSSKRYKRN